MSGSVLFSKARRFFKSVFVSSLILASCTSMSEAQTWKNLLVRADSLSTTRNHDSAITLATHALADVEREFGATDTLVAQILERLGIYMYENDEFQDAKIHLTKALAMKEISNGTSSQILIPTLQSLAKVFVKTSEYSKADSLYARAFQILDDSSSSDSLLIADHLFLWGQSYYLQGSLLKADSLYKEVLDIRKQFLDSRDPKIGEALFGIGVIHWSFGRMSAAEQHFDSALSIVDSAEIPDLLLAARIKTGLAVIKSNKMDFARAKELYESAISIYLEEYGAEHSRTINVQGNFAQLLISLGKYHEADSLLGEILLIQKRLYDPLHPDIAWTYSLLGTIQYYEGAYDKAAEYQNQALQIEESIYGSENPKLISSLNNLASFLASSYENRKAEMYYKRSLAIVENHFGPNNLELTASLTGLSILLQRTGKYAEALSMLQRVLSIDEEAYGYDNPNHAVTLHNLAILSEIYGRFPEAIQYIKRAIRLTETSVGRGNPEVAKSQIILAVLYSDIGKNELALQTLLEANETITTSLGEKHPIYKSILTNLTRQYRRLEEFSKADSVGNKFLAYMEKEAGEDDPSLAGPLRLLGDVSLKQKNYERANGYYNRAMTLYSSVSKEKSKSFRVDIGLFTHSLAICNLLQGNYARAESLAVLSIENADYILQTRGVGEWMKSSRLETLSGVYRYTGRITEATRLADSAFRIRQVKMRDATIGMSERDLLRFNTGVRHTADNFLTCFFESRDSSSMTHAADAVFITKGKVSDEVYRSRQEIAAEAGSTSDSTAEAYRYNKFLLSKLLVKGPEGNLNTYREQVDSFYIIIDSLETELALHSASFRRFKSNQDVSTARIDSQLPQNTVLLEYLKYNYLQLNPDTAIPHYLAVVLGGSGESAIVELGAASEIDSLIESYRQLVAPGRFPTQSDLAKYAEIAQALYQKVWDPLDEYLTDAKKIFVAPDGGLNLISFATLVDSDGKYLIERFPIHYLSAGRDLIRLKDKTASGSGLLAIGDPNFDATIAQRQEKSQPPTIASSDAQNLYVTRSFRSGCGELSELEVKGLPETRKEIDRIVDSWSGGDVTTFLGAQASEDNFKNNAPGKRVIHLATHGYFLEGKCNPANQPKPFDQDYTFVGENPLLLSGLLFAGSNLHGVGADNAKMEDGVLSAYEVSALDLTGVDMVVLSACETGLGEVKEGEGVYGLRRAFQLAGARTVISSLWPVDDKITASLMAELYIESDESLPEKMRGAQLAQIKKLRKAGLADHPFTWGAWIATGDWR